MRVLGDKLVLATKKQFVSDSRYSDSRNLLLAREKDDFLSQKAARAGDVHHYSQAVGMLAPSSEYFASVPEISVGEIHELSHSSSCPKPPDSPLNMHVVLASAQLWQMIIPDIYQCVCHGPCPQEKWMKSQLVPMHTYMHACMHSCIHTHDKLSVDCENRAESVH